MHFITENRSLLFQWCRYSTLLAFTGLHDDRQHLFFPAATCAHTQPRRIATVVFISFSAPCCKSAKKLRTHIYTRNEFAVKFIWLLLLSSVECIAVRNICQPKIFNGLCDLRFLTFFPLHSSPLSLCCMRCVCRAHVYWRIYCTLRVPHKVEPGDSPPWNLSDYCQANLSSTSVRIQFYRIPKRKVVSWLSMFTILSRINWHYAGLKLHVYYKQQSQLSLSLNTLLPFSLQLNPSISYTHFAWHGPNHFHPHCFVHLFCFFWL